LSITATTSTIQLAIDYAGLGLIPLIFNGCNAVRSFSTEFWALQAVFDNFFKDTIQIKRDRIIGKMRDLINILPYLKSDPLKQLCIFSNLKTSSI
jgi:hypothetical protein